MRVRLHKGKFGDAVVIGAEALGKIRIHQIYYRPPVSAINESHIAVSHTLLRQEERNDIDPALICSKNPVHPWF